MINKLVLHGKYREYSTLLATVQDANPNVPELAYIPLLMAMPPEQVEEYRKRGFAMGSEPETESRIQELVKQSQNKEPL